MLVAKRNAFEDAIATGSFDSLVAQQKLTAQQTPALLSNGVDPDNPTAKPDPALTLIVAAAFAAQPGDSPQTVPTSRDGSFALIQLAKVIPSAPRPLAQIRETVVRDFILDRGQRAAHQAAAAIVAAATKGATFADAVAATKLKLPPIKPIAGPRAALLANPRAVPPPLALLFAMAPKTTKLLEAPNKAGYYLIHLDTIEAGDATGKDQVIAGTQGDIGKVIGREYAAEFGKAVQQAVGTTRNAAAIAKLKAELLGNASTDDQP